MVIEATSRVILIPMACVKCPKVRRLTDSTVLALTRWADTSNVHCKREQRGGHEAALSGPAHVFTSVRLQTPLTWNSQVCRVVCLFMDEDDVIHFLTEGTFIM